MAHEKLRAEIKRRFGSEAALARKMGWSRQRMSNLVRGRKKIKISDVNILSRGVGIPVSEVIGLIDLQEMEQQAG